MRDTVRAPQGFCYERWRERDKQPEHKGLWAGLREEQQGLTWSTVCEKVPWLSMEGLGGGETSSGAVAVPQAGSPPGERPDGADTALWRGERSFQRD